jgi:serine/threonine protein phosphatase PrpC
LSKQLRLDVAQLTDVGRKRPHNEDNMAYVIPKDGQVMAKKGALFIVADGMGGHAAGEVASEIAVDTVSSIYYQDENDDLALSLMNAIKRANALIHQRAAENMLRSGMGTTCVAAVLRGDMAYVANVGDSRAYLVRKGQAKQVSQDHSWVEEQVRAGLLTKDQARSHAQRNVITRSLGTQAEVEVDVFSEVLEEGDTLILCSDGLSGSIGEDDLRAIVNQYVPQESVYHLVERANENGGPDNITAIVVRVQEVGEESPRTLYPVQVGGRITDESTVVLGRIPSSSLSMPVRVEDVRMPSGPLSAPSGPLFSSSTSTQAAVAAPPRRRRTLLLPLVILLVLLVVLVVGAGAYLFFLRPANTQAKLNEVSDLIVQARGATNNPNAALQNLAKAQNELRSVKSSSLNQQQSDQFTTLQNSLESEFKVALANYDKATLITALPCIGGSPTVIDSSASHTTPSTLLTVKDEKNAVFSYVHMADSSLYQVNDQQKTLGNKYAVPVVLLTNDTQHIFVLTTPNSQGTPSYELHVLKPGQNGALSEQSNAPKVTIPSELINQGFKPQLMTSWNGDIYIVLTSAQSTQSNANQAVVLDYKLDKLQDAPQRAKISISTGLVGVAAFPGRQLFLLHNDGTLKSLQVGSANPSEIDVEVSQPIATPWPVDSQRFTPATPIVSPPPPAKNKLLSIPVPVVTTPPQSFLASGQVDNMAHLYITDNTNHRVLDFTTTTGGSTNAGTPTPTPTSSATSAAGGGMVSPAGGTGEVDMQLVQQYTSPTILPAVRSSVVDPSGTRLDLMTMDGNTYASVAVGVSQKNACAPQ